MVYAVHVGDIGIVHRGDSREQAIREYESYEADALQRRGRVAGKSVRLLEDDQVLREYIGDAELAALRERHGQHTVKAQVVTRSLALVMLVAGLLFFVTGALMTTTVIGAIIGIPVICFGVIGIGAGARFLFGKLS